MWKLLAYYWVDGAWLLVRQPLMILAKEYEINSVLRLQIGCALENEEIYIFRKAPANFK